LKELLPKIRCEILVCLAERDTQVIIPNGDYCIRHGDLLTFIATKEKSLSFFRKVGDKNAKIRDVLIVGGGNVSFYLAQFLIKSGISVKIIELNRERCEFLTDNLPEAEIIHADGSKVNILKEERVDKMDAFVALTGFDEENILLSVAAMQENPIMKIVTKINHTHFGRILGKLSLDSIINPTAITTEKIVRFVRSKSAGITGDQRVETLYKLGNGRAEALEFKISTKSALINKPLMDLQLRTNVLIAHIRRGNASIIPRGMDKILPDDSVIVVTTLPGISDIEEILK